MKNLNMMRKFTGPDEYVYDYYHLIFLIIHELSAII